MSYYSNYGRSSRGSNTSIGELVIMIIIVIFLSMGMRACNRSDSHMIYIEDGYCYHEETHIIYIESRAGRYGTRVLYTPYYDENGKMAIYNPETGEWTAVD